MVIEIGLCLWITNKVKLVLRESLNGGIGDRALCEDMKLKFGLPWRIKHIRVARVMVYS